MSTSATFIGPALVGVFLNVMLHGVMGMQCCVYYNCFSRDPKWIRVLVAGLLFANTVNTVFDIWWAYDVFANHFLDPSALKAANWLFSTDPAMVGLIATTVQMFYAWRIKVLTHNNHIAWFIRITSLGSIVGGVGSAAAVHWVPDFADFHKFKAITIIWFASSLVCDATIAVTVTTFMLRNKTGIAVTDKIVKRLTALTISNGLLVSVVALLNLITFLALPSSGLYLAFNFPLAKLYTNSLMSTLNSRLISQRDLAASTTAGSEHHTPTARVGRLAIPAFFSTFVNSSPMSALVSPQLELRPQTKLEPIAFEVNSRALTDSKNDLDPEYGPEPPSPPSSIDSERRREKAPTDDVYAVAV